MPEEPKKRSSKEDQEREAADAVVLSFPDVSIDKMRDAPDADLLRNDGSHIGLEIVRMADERQLTLRRRLVAASERIQSEMAARSIQGVFRIYYDIQEMFDDDNKKAWDRRVPKAIADHFAVARGAHVGAAELAQNGITCISHIDVADASRLHVGCGWRVSTTAGSSLAEIALASKEQKLAAYRAGAENSHFREYWLAMASLGDGTPDDGGYTMLLNRQFKTDYDRVLLLMHGSNGRLTGAQDITPKK